MVFFCFVDYSMKVLMIICLFFAITFAQFEYVPEDENIIILVGPDNYYANSLNEFVNFHVDYAISAGSRDHFFVVINNYNDNLYEAQLPDEMLISATINDIWVRDFGIQNLQGLNHKFDYSPDYLDNWTSNWIDNSFINWFNETELDYLNHNIVLDGGNFQTNGYDKVVITTRIFDDNPTLTEIQLRNYFNANLGLDEIAFIPEDVGDPVGHSDGYVIWLTPSKLAVNNFDEPYLSQIYAVLETSFADVEFIEMPYVPNYSDGADGFGSAEGIYVNSLQTTDNFYVPIFGLAEDSLALAIYAEHTNKNIIPIDASEVSNWGGSVHCLAIEILRADENQLGDVNEDGVINVLDVIMMVGFVLNNEYNELSDLNLDGTLDILDIVQLINIILN